MSDSLLPLIPMTDHERRVHEMMRGYRQATPDEPTMPDENIRATRVALLLEEVLEFAEESAITVQIHFQREYLTLLPKRVPLYDLQCEDGCWSLMNTPNREPNLVGMIDALADISVVNTGAFVACGVRMTPVLECVDANNLLKIATGRLDEESGKFIKAPNHPKPDFAYVLRAQNYQGLIVNAA